MDVFSSYRYGVCITVVVYICDYVFSLVGHYRALEGLGD